MNSSEPILFSGRELFILYTVKMNSCSVQEAEELWETSTGKQKKATWLYMASVINSRLKGEG